MFLLLHDFSNQGDILHRYRQHGKTSFPITKAKANLNHTCITISHATAHESCQLTFGNHQLVTLIILFATHNFVVLMIRVQK